MRKQNICTVAKVLWDSFFILRIPSDFKDVNSARMDMFFKKNQNLEHVPPSENALLQHTKKGSLPNWDLVKMFGTNAK